MARCKLAFKNHLNPRFQRKGMQKRTGRQQPCADLRRVQRLRRLEHDFGVAFRAIGECPADPRVATQVLGLVNLPPNQPHQRIPPIDGRNDQLDDAHPVIASPQMGELVSQNQGRALVIELAMQPHRQNDRRATAGEPQQGNLDAFDIAHVGHPSDAELAGDFRRESLQPLRRRQRVS